MIKALLGATALIAVTLSAVGSAVAEEGPELGLGGYYKTFSWAGANEPGSGPGAALHDSDQGARFDLPPISGLQIGLSRDPAPAAEGDDDIAPLRASADGEFRDLLSVSASYIDSFVGLDLAVTAGYGLAADEADGIYDPQHYSAGVDVGFSNFTVGGALGVADGGRPGDGLAWDAGATYSVGPWMIGASYFHGTGDGVGGGEDQLEALQSGVSYAFGPGITASANVLWSEWEGADGDNSAGFGGLLGMQVGF